MNTLDKWAFGLMCDVYNPAQPRDEKGRWTSGGWSGKIKKTKYAPSKRRYKEGIDVSPEEIGLISGELLRWHTNAFDREGRYLVESNGYIYAVDTKKNGSIIVRKKRKV